MAGIAPQIRADARTSGAPRDRAGLIPLRGALLGYARVPGDRDDGLPEPPRLPERAAIYIAPDGSVKFGALFEGLLPVAEAISGRPLPRAERGKDRDPGKER